MSEEKRKDVLQWDKRVMHRYVTEGKMTQKELDHHLAKLPDLTEQSKDISGLIYGEQVKNQTDV